jgi:hypothetical protein
MSETEYHRGKVREVAMDCKTFSEKIKYIEKDMGISIDDIEREEFEEFGMLDEPQFVIINNRLFKVIEDNRFEDMDIIEAKKTEERNYDFTLVFYNGCSCFSENLIEASKKEID